jgi:hypothetical protein
MYRRNLFPPKSSTRANSKAQPRRRSPDTSPERNWPPAATPAQRSAGQTHIMSKITLPQAAILLHVPDYTCRRLAFRGALGPIESVAGRYLLDSDAVQAYVDQGQRAKSATGSPLPTRDASASAVESAGTPASAPTAVDTSPPAA